MSQNPQNERVSRRDAERMVRAIPHDELPDGGDRAALIDAIAAGAVEDVYRPIGAGYHNVTIPHLPPYVDPRLKVAEWAALRRAGRDIRVAILDEYTQRTIAAITYTRQTRQQAKGGAW